MADEPNEFGSFLREIGTREVLSKEREQELSRRARAGDQQAKELLVEHNIKLVISIAKRYARMGHSMEDLVQEGTLGVMRAVEKFDPDKGFKFSTYATFWVKQRIQRYISGPGGNAIRVPGQAQRDRRHLRERMKKYDESLEEAAEALEIDIDDAIEAMEGPRVSASIDAAVSDDPSRDGQHALIPDPGAPDPADVVAESNTDLDAALEELTSQQRKIVEMRHGLGGPVMSRNDVADELGVGAKVVQEEHSVALTKIKRLLLKWAAERTGMEEEEAAVKAVFEAFADDEEEDPYVRGV